MNNGEDEPFVEYYPSGAQSSYASVRGIMLEIFTKLTQNSALWGIEHTRTLLSNNYFYKFFYRHFLRSTIIVAAEPNVKLRSVNMVLDEIQKEILTMKHPSHRALLHKVKDCVHRANNFAQYDTISIIQQQVDELRDSMVDNLEQVIGRSVQIEVVQSSTENLEQAGKLFRRDTRKVRCMTRCRAILCCCWF